MQSATRLDSCGKLKWDNLSLIRRLLRSAYPMYNDFVEIDEKSTPYYQFVHQQNVFSQDPVMNQGSIVDIQPCVLVDEPKGKNSIFDMDHSISKPVTKMTAEEIEELKSGITPISKLKTHASISSLKARENKSIFVPVSSTTYAARAPAATPLPPLPIPNPRTAFLQRESVTTLPDLDINDFRSRKDNVELVNYMPIRKNLLGYGQFSQVYSGTFITKKSTIERPCAVKKLNPSGDAQLLGLREVKMLSQISHTSVITLIDAWDESGTDKDQVWKLAEAVDDCETNLEPDFQLCIALEYCANGSIWDWIQRYPDALSCKLFVKWSKQVLAGLQEIHTLGIIHHDIKPHNVLVLHINYSSLSYWILESAILEMLCLFLKVEWSNLAES